MPIHYCYEICRLSHNNVQKTWLHSTAIINIGNYDTICYPFYIFDISVHHTIKQQSRLHSLCVYARRNLSKRNWKVFEIQTLPMYLRIY